MALTQVRVKLGDTWVNLTYNGSTGRYEGTLIPPGTSYHQPGGYFSITAEATNQNGETASISGEQLPALRLVVRETTAPTLTLISPPPGFLQTQSPTFVFQATDEEGGSGINPERFSLAGATVEAISGGYRFTWSPPGGWADGSHTITASVADYDGNEAAVSGAYIVDTVPPELLLHRPDQRHVVDDESVVVAGEAWDATTPDVTVQVAGKPVEMAGGRFKVEVPLTIGENRIPVTVTDGAGNHTTQEVYMIRLVTDRTANDVEFLRELYKKPWEAWPEADRAWFWETVCLRGSYDAGDWNRVGAAVRWLSGELERRGFIASVQAKTDWTEDDEPTQEKMSAYLQDVENVRSAQGLYFTEIPETLRFSSCDGWNRIEKALVEVDEVFHRYSAWTSGEITCGGV